MPLFSREKLPALLKQADSNPSQVYLMFGERYLCRDASAKIEECLLRKPGTVHVIDGEHEDMGSLVNKLRSYSLLPGRSIYRVNDTRLFHSKNIARNLWDKAVKAHQGGKTRQAERAILSLLKTGGIRPSASEANLVELTPSEWNHCFGFNKPDQDISWTTTIIAELQNREEVSGPVNTDPAALLMDALNKGLPQGTFLLLLAEEADKRKKIFKYLKEHHTVLDVSVETGASTKARKKQDDVLLSLIRQKLKERQKSITPKATEMLLERVGFHPVGVVNELDKVLLYIGDRAQISEGDIDAMVGRTRQEAVFELTAALAQNNLEQVLVVSSRLQDNGIHPLALIATLRNYTRSLLLYRSLLEQPQYGFSPSMSAQVFQNKCLPLLKENETWKKELSGHPYALYMQFKTAASYPLSRLKRWMRLILQAELRLKGSPIQAQTVLQQLFTEMLVSR